METKNLIRQNFIRDDVGRNKAEVLAERYTELYDNISVSFVAKYATYRKFDSKYLPDNEYSPEHFVCLDQLRIKKNDILINLVDNEGFKKKLDWYINRNHNYLFAAGVNLFNGQAYFSNNRYTNGYVNDHPDLLNIFDEVSVHACADHDANGTDDNPEQLFNGNDLCASILANLYQTVLTDIPLYKRINFVSGGNINVSCGDRNYSYLYEYLLKYCQDYASDYNMALSYFLVYKDHESVKQLKTKASKKYDAIIKQYEGIDIVRSAYNNVENLDNQGETSEVDLSTNGNTVVNDNDVNIFTEAVAAVNDDF